MNQHTSLQTSLPCIVMDKVLPDQLKGPSDVSGHPDIPQLGFTANVTGCTSLKLRQYHWKVVNFIAVQQVNYLMSSHSYFPKVTMRGFAGRPALWWCGKLACRQTLEGGRQVNIAGSEPTRDLSSLLCSVGFVAALEWSKHCPFWGKMTW